MQSLLNEVINDSYKCSSKSCQQSSGKNTAVKIIAKKKLSEEDLAALMSEISILCELDHPHIIK